MYDLIFGEIDMRKFSYILALVGEFMVLALHARQQPSQLPKESVYVHCSKTIGVAGEAIPLSLMIRMDDGPTPSTFAYADLISRSGERFGGEVIPLDEGQASAYLSIPANTPSDNYLLRVYSRLAASQSDESQYHQEVITVINPRIPPQMEASNDGGEWQSLGPSQDISISAAAGNLRIDTSSKVRVMATPNQKIAVSISRKNPFLPSSRLLPGQTKHSEMDPSSELIPELRGHIIKGTLMGEKVDTTKLYFLSAHGNQSALYLGQPNPEGEVYFDLGALKKYDFLLLQSDVDSIPFNIQLEMPFAPAPRAESLHLPVLSLTEEDKKLLDELILSYSTTEYYWPPAALSTQPIVTGYSPDRGYNLDDYNRFVDLATTLKEYVPTVLVRKKAGKYHFRLTNIPAHSLFDGNPLMLIDGMPVFDSDALARFSPEKIKRAEVINRSFYILNSAFEGVLSFTSFDNDFGGYPIPDRALYLEYPQIQQPVLWNVNRQEPAEKHAPDFRTLLYWNGSLMTGEDGAVDIDFHTSRVPGEYEIRVSSQDENGQISWKSYDLVVTE